MSGQKQLSFSWKPAILGYRFMAANSFSLSDMLGPITMLYKGIDLLFINSLTFIKTS